MNLKKLFQSFNPSKTLDISNPEDGKYYIDFSSVRSKNLIRELKRTIVLSGESSCQLFTGHIGCGKSTELLRLKAELEEQNFHVVYFVSHEELDMGDIDITDILLLIARKIVESLDKIGIRLKPSYFSRLFGEIKELLFREIDLEPGMEVKLGLAKITAKTKASPNFRAKLRDFLEVRTDTITASVNEEVLKPAIQKLKEMGKEGLVVIVDNLERMDNKEKPSGRTQPEYIFADRGEQLKKLCCHLLYTIPLTLIFSNEANTINNRFGVKPKTLSMVPVQCRDGNPHEEGLALLRQMVMARVFPDLTPEERLGKTEVLFEHPDMLDRLCKTSGGHVRNLLGFLFSCLQKDDPPFSDEILDEVIQEYRDDLLRNITPDKWELLRQVVGNQSVAGEEEYDILLRCMFVFEYQEKDGAWFGVNPLLAGMDRLRSEGDES